MQVCTLLYKMLCVLIRFAAISWLSNFITRLGYATLSLSIEGPSKAEIECTDNSDGTCTVAYCPTEPGTYHVNVRYADHHVPGSPFTVHVGGEASQRMVQRIVRSRQAFEATQVGSECALTVRITSNSFFCSSFLISSFILHFLDIRNCCISRSIQVSGPQLFCFCCSTKSTSRILKK